MCVIIKLRKGKNKENWSEENVKGEKTEVIDKGRETKRSPTDVVNKPDRNCLQIKKFLGFLLNYINQ